MQGAAMRPVYVTRDEVPADVVASERRIAEATAREEGKPAQALSEFYSSIFAQVLQASQSASREKFEHAIECVRNVRDAWRQVAIDPEVNPAPLQVNDLSSGAMRQEFAEADYGMESGAGSSWNA